MSVVLITGARLPKAHALKKSLSTETILLGDYCDLPTLPGTQSLFEKLPSPQSQSYIHQFLTSCLALQVNKVYVLDPLEILPLQGAIMLFSDYSIELEFRTD
ncbi:MAG: hypothetical protein ACKOWL_00950 [Sphingobacteriaceae bacterium]